MGPWLRGSRVSPSNEWLARKHGTQRRRQYRKVHLAMDTTTGDIRAVEFTSSDKGDSPVLPRLLAQIPVDEQIGTVTGDGAFDTKRDAMARSSSAAAQRSYAAARTGGDGARTVPPPLDMVLGPVADNVSTRNEILKATQRLGRAAWKRWSGYHTRSRIEARMRCLKPFGERIASRDPHRQTAEVQIRVALINRFNALGTAEIERVA